MEQITSILNVIKKTLYVKIVKELLKMFHPQIV